MKHHLLILLSIGCCSLVFSQELPSKIFPKIKEDSAFSSRVKPQTFFDLLSKKDLMTSIKMPNAKPKDYAIYSALKGKRRNADLYKILNTIAKKDQFNKTK